MDAVRQRLPDARRRPRPLRRFMLGAAGIVICTTIAIAAVAIGAVSTIAADLALGGKPIRSNQLTAAAAGAAQTILVVGDDHIGATTTYATGKYETVNGVHLLHADTFMLVRLDPAHGQTSILSIPRDLLVHFTWQGRSIFDKFNSTYSVGHIGLTLRVARQVLPQIPINHVIDFNFAAFLGIVDAIGCVYVDVDQRYYNAPGGTYEPIDLQPGYQRLCHTNALEYVRYRHTDSDFVRVARQQDFIRQAKQQLGVWGFVTRYQSLAKAFGKAVHTDIHSDHDVTQLIELAILSLGKNVRQVPFQVSSTDAAIGNEIGVTSTPSLIRATEDQFLYQVPPAPTIVATASHTVHQHHHTHHASASASSGLSSIDLYPLSSGVRTEAQRISVDVPFSVYLPSYQTGPAIPNDFHPYAIRDEHNRVHYGYRIDWLQNQDGGYYGIEGMNWTDPPLFDNPSETVKLGGRTYLIVDDGSHIHDIGWRVGHVLYWISNTLLEDLSNAQMLNLAESAQPAH